MCRAVSRAERLCHLVMPEAGEVAPYRTVGVLNSALVAAFGDPEQLDCPFVMARNHLWSLVEG